MAFFHFKNVRVAGIAAGVPSIVVSNLNSERRISPDYENADFVATTGVVERRFDNELTTSDLCFKAARQLLSDLDWDAKDIDAIVMVSQTLDFVLPATACILQDKLGCSKECYAEDIQIGCSGWVYGVSTVAGLLQNGDIKKALLMCGDARGQYIRPGKEDPLFGHAGTVTALEFEDGNDGLKCHFGTDGSGYEAIIKYQGGARYPMSPETFEERIVDGKSCTGLTSIMKGMDVFAFGISTAPKSIKKLSEKYAFNYLDYDYFIFHQANKKMNEMIVKKLKLDPARVPLCMPHFGNTSSASIPLTIVSELRGKADKQDTSIICCGFGVGLSWGTIAFRTHDMVISNLVEVNSDEHML